MTGVPSPSSGGIPPTFHAVPPAGANPTSPASPDGVREDPAAAARDLRHTVLDPSLLRTLAVAMAGQAHGELGVHLAVLLRDPASVVAQEPPDVVPSRLPVPRDMWADVVGNGLVGMLEPRARRRAWRAARASEARVRPAQLAHLREQWDAQISAYVPAHMADALSQDRVPAPPPPPSLLEFGVDYLCWHLKGGTPAFLRPFKQLVEREIAIPDNIAMALRRGSLSFDTFCDLVQACAREIPPKVPAGFFSLHSFLPPDHVPAGRQYADDWKRGFAAICSPLAAALVEGGALSAEALVEWTGMRAHAQRYADRAAAQADDAAAFPAADPDGDPADDPAEPFLAARHITSLLASWSLDENAKPTRNAALLRDPGVLRTLADSLVPRKHIEYLLSVADSVRWPVLAAEIERVVKQYQAYYEPDAAYLDPKYWKSMTFYEMSAEAYGLSNEETARYLNESYRNMAPYQLLAQSRVSGRLDAWTVVLHKDEGEQPWTSLRWRPAQTLFDQWSLKGIPIDQQVWISRFLEQGFDESWARDAVGAHAAHPIRLAAWFSHGHHADLRGRLDGAMQAVVLYWLNDIEIAPDMLALAPAMIESDISGEWIDEMLRATAYASRLQAVFGPGADTPRQVLYGFTTPQQLVHRIVHGGESLAALRDSATRELPPVFPLRRELADTRTCLRRALHAMKGAHGEIAADTPVAARCACLILAWEEALQLLDRLLQPDLDEDAPDQRAAIFTALTALSANFPLHAAMLDVPASPVAPASRV